jgi:hypothetical protein
VLLAAAAAVITVRNPVFAALCLVLAFFSSAAIWMLLEVEFLAIILVLVYVGAVLVLFLFVVMMLDINIEPLREGFIRYLPAGIVVALLMAAELLLVLWARGRFDPAAGRQPGRLQQHPRRRRVAVHELPAGLRSGRRRAAGCDHRGGGADPALAYRRQAPESVGAGARPARRAGASGENEPGAAPRPGGRRPGRALRRATC